MVHMESYLRSRVVRDPKAGLLAVIQKIRGEPEDSGMPLGV